MCHSTFFLNRVKRDHLTWHLSSTASSTSPSSRPRRAVTSSKMYWCRESNVARLRSRSSLSFAFFVCCCCCCFAKFKLNALCYAMNHCICLLFTFFSLIASLLETAPSWSRVVVAGSEDVFSCCGLNLSACSVMPSLSLSYVNKTNVSLTNTHTLSLSFTFSCSSFFTN